MKKLAALVALSLLGVMPAGVAWAHHDKDGHSEHPGCENSREGKNKHCEGADQPPRNDGNQSASAPAPQPAPKHRLDDLDGDGIRNSDDRCAVQASNGCGNQQEQTYDADGDKRPDVVDACSTSQGCSDADLIAQYQRAVEIEGDRARRDVEAKVAEVRQRLSQP